MAVEPIVLEIDDLCTTLGIGKNTAYELLNSNEIDSFKIGACWKVPKKSLDEYIERKCKERKKKVLCKVVNK